MEQRFKNGNTKLDDSTMRLILRQVETIDEQIKVLQKSKRKITDSFGIRRETFHRRRLYFQEQDKLKQEQQA